MKCSNRICNKELNEDDINVGAMPGYCFRCGEHMWEAQQEAREYELEMENE